MSTNYNKYTKLIPLLFALFFGIMLHGQQRPNVFIIICDDLGYGDLGCTGHPVLKTPNIDTFSTKSRRVRMYAGSSVCSPSRFALMTGKIPIRGNVLSVYDRETTFTASKNEVTMADVFKEQGYQCIHAGKWHLATPFYVPGNAVNLGGFHETYDGPQYTKAIDVFNAAKGPILAARNAGKPIFTFIGLHEPHDPQQTKVTPPQNAYYNGTIYNYINLTSDPAPHIGLSNYKPPIDSIKYYYGCISAMDAAFGNFIAFLKANNLYDNSIILFTSDNGPAKPTNQNNTNFGSAGPFSSGKKDLFEGGLRVPGFVRFPAHNWTSGNIENGAPIVFYDIFKTFTHLCGFSTYNEWDQDGEDVTAIIDGTATQRQEGIYWMYPYATHRLPLNPSSTSPYDWLESTKYTSNFAYLDKNGRYKVIHSMECMPSWTTIIEQTRYANYRTNEGPYFFDLSNDVIELNDVKALHPSEYVNLYNLFLAKDKKIRRKIGQNNDVNGDLNIYNCN